MLAGKYYEHDQQRPYVQIHKRPYINPLENAFDHRESDRDQKCLPAVEDRVNDKQKRYDLNIGQQIKGKL